MRQQSQNPSAMVSRWCTLWGQQQNRNYNTSNTLILSLIYKSKKESLWATELYDYLDSCFPQITSVFSVCPLYLPQAPKIYSKVWVLIKYLKRKCGLGKNTIKDKSK